VQFAPLAQEVFIYFLVFCRVGSAFVTLPGVGEAFVNVRIRLLFAIAVSLVMAPALADTLPELPVTVSRLFLLIGGEVFYGFVIGLMARFLVTALAWGGTVISFLSGFSAAQIFNPLLADQGSLSAVVLSLGGLLLIYATDSHHLMFYAIADSYRLFVPGSVPAFGPVADSFARLLANSFFLAMQLATPFIVFAIVFYTGIGLMARLQPTLPIFFVALPLQITAALFILVLTISTLLLWFLDRFEASLSVFFVPS